MIAVIQAFKFIPPINGGHRAGYAFCKELHQLHPMVCITTSNNPEGKAPFQIIRLFEDNKRKYFSPTIANTIITKLTELKVNTLVLNQPFMALLLFRKLRKAGIKIVLYAHNIEYQRFKSMGKPWWPVLYQLEKWSMRFADRILFISDDDLKAAQQLFQLPETKLISAPYALSQQKSPVRVLAQQAIRQQLGLKDTTKLLYFYGPMDYLPNREALLILLQKIIPKLEEKGEDFLLMLSGKGLDHELETLIANSPTTVKWLGFVDDFEQQLQAADIMLNPIWLGGGVKIKLMEALANGVTAISFQSGALGIDAATAQQKLQIVPDQNADLMVEQIIKLSRQDCQMATPDSYYQRYSGKHIVQHFLDHLS